MDFWRRSARISRKDKIRNNIIEQKMNVIRSLLADINPLNAELNPICHLLALLGAHHFLDASRIKVKTKQLQWYGHVQRMEEERLPKEVM